MAMAVKKTSGETSENKALQLAIDAITKQHGKEAVSIGGSSKAFRDIERIKTGSMSLDIALTGGYAKGRIVEIYGPESSGKTTLALHAIAECQKEGGTAAFIDM